jgi:restriction system protein
MAVPAFASYLLPTLIALKEKSPAKSRDVAHWNAKHFQLSEEDLNTYLASGTQLVHDNRNSWALQYLLRAKLADRPSRGVYLITERGKQFLSQNPTELTPKILSQFDEFKEFAYSRSPEQENKTAREMEYEITKSNLDETPEEQAALSFVRLREQICNELLNRLKSNDPEFFEKTVVTVIVSMGYGGSLQDAGQAIGRSGDGGIDGIINEDKLGLDVLYLQAKRWDGVVGRPEIQKFAGALQGKRARKGIFITTSDYTKDAREYVQIIDSKIVLISGKQFSELMWEHNVGVTPASTYIVKKIDSDFFDE